MSETKNIRIYLKGEDRTDSIQDFKRIGDKYEITFYGGKSFKYNLSNVRIVESSLNNPKSRNCFEYLKRIADEVGLKAEVDEGKVINILSHNYSKIEFVSPDCVFGAFISGKQTTESEYNVSKSKETTVYPFGFNVSQKNAVDKALKNSLSIIEGPPGTGKTQTILNIIANVIIRGESIAVVSSNNSATKNVYDKLKKSNVDFIAAYLGNTNNKSVFIETQKKLPDDVESWKLKPDEVAKLKEQLNHNHESLEGMLILQQALSKLKQELSSIKTEQKHFLLYSISGMPEQLQSLNTSRETLDMWLLCEGNKFSSSKNKLITFFKKILEFLHLINKKELFIRKMLKVLPIEEIITAFQERFYELKISELEDEITKVTLQLETFDFNSKMKEYSENSMKVFKSHLAIRYEVQKRETWNIDDLWRNSEAFIRDYPVILSTTYSLRSSLANNVMYDYVIIDESSQVDLCTGALALSCARKAVIVGDLKQLPHVVDSKTSNITDSIFHEFGLHEAYRYKNQSLLSSLIKIFPEAPKTLLREHYRCHPKIIEFCNKKFYGGELVILTDTKTDREPLIVYKTVEGNHERNRMNQRQIDVIKEEVIPQQALNTSNGSVGIITPYRNQTNALQKAFSNLKVKADTVDKFQGQENSVIILSTVDNEVTEFSDNANRLNVAISRAIDQLIVVVSETDTKRDTNIGDLVRYIEYNNLSVIESKVHSVFDYLYASYLKRRKDFLANHKKVSGYDSENLIYAILVKILKEKNMYNLSIAIHVPLRMIIKSTELLSPQEYKYAINVNTHVDFLVYDNVTKTAKLIIEVDGVSYHKDGSRQAERDNLKNGILNKYNLQFLRLKTNGSGEEKHIIEALDSLNSN